MRSLIASWTAILAVAVTILVASMDSAAGTRGPLVLFRAGIACLIVVLAGRLAGFVLMRTALRRHYEQWRMTQAGSRPRSER
jgi:multisubunit Na+/H+ antiporter MnhG subunit